MAKKKGGPQAAYKHGRFGAVWAWAKGHLPRFVKARNWAARRKEKSPNSGFGKAEKAYAKKVAFLRKHQDPHGTPKGHFTTFDGLPVPTWIVRDVLKPARKDGVSFTVISGYRSPEYSEQLCEQICGAPSCPGRCAGRSSNHCCPPTFTGRKPEGAVDVYPGAPALDAWCQKHGNPLIGNGRVLPADPNHFSAHGN